VIEAQSAVALVLVQWAVSDWAASGEMYPGDLGVKPVKT
jgi:hypothetical protein